MGEGAPFGHLEHADEADLEDRGAAQREGVAAEVEVAETLPRSAGEIEKGRGEKRRGKCERGRKEEQGKWELEREERDGEKHSVGEEQAERQGGGGRERGRETTREGACGERGGGAGGWA